jgi:hypothetical protein
MKQVVAILSVLILLGCFFTMTNIIIVPIATPNKISNPDSSEDTDPERNLADLQVVSQHADSTAIAESR